MKVHEDGSAYFTVPAKQNIFFQALDEDFMALQEMATFINMMPGERRSCIGCHETRRNAPEVAAGRPLALGHPVQELIPQPGDTGPRMVDFTVDVQPILDKHCVECHSGENPKGALDLSNTLTSLWRVSYISYQPVCCYFALISDRCGSTALAAALPPYENLIRKDLVGHLDGGFGSSNVPLEKPMTFGSHQNKMIKQMREVPCKTDLTREEFIKIVTWIDANCPFYGTHEGCKSAEGKDRPDFRPVPLAEK